MHIKDGYLYDGDKRARWVKANACGGEMKAPRWVVLHDTAGRLTPFSSVNWFASKECSTSAHFVVERDGTVTQMVPTNRRAWHAGPSSWKGVVGLNSCSIGIEIVNPGRLDEGGKAWFGKAAEPSEIVFKGTPNHGNGWWLPYTPEQIESVKRLCRALVEEYPECNEIVTHWEISPGRKIDVGPLFPLRELRKQIFDPTPGQVEHEKLEAPPVPAATPAPSVAPPAQAPGLVKATVESKTVWSMIVGAGLWVMSKIETTVGWLGERVDRLVSLVSNVSTDVEGGLAPFVSLGGLLKTSIAVILPTLALVLTVVAISRHVRDRRELAALKRELAEMKG